jgi:hypothetical protein
MMNSGSSTETPAASRDAGLQPWHFYLLLAMGAASWAVITSRHNQPAALLLLTAGILAAGAAAAALHHALLGFFGGRGTGLSATANPKRRETLEREKMLVLRSIKELEFDHAMKKLSDADFEDLSGRLRQRALSLLEEIDRVKPDEPPAAAATRVDSVPEPPAASVGNFCASCGAAFDADARFCKHCGAKRA